MKTVSRSIKVFVSLILVSMLFLSLGCEKSGPMNPIEPINQQTSNSQQQFKPLSFKSTAGNSGLNRIITSVQYVTQANGGMLQVMHGNASGTAANFMYGTSIIPPYEVYQLDPIGYSGQTVGQLAFAASAIAMHPYTGRLYYLAYEPSEGIYRVGVWNPEDNTNRILPQGAPFRPAGKLAFDLDGNLYGVSYYNSNQLYKINTMTGEWTLFRSYNYYMGAGGDLAISPDNKIYNILDGYLDIVNLNSNYLNTVGYVNLTGISGLCFGYDGTLYLSLQNGDIYEVDPNSGATTYLGSTGVQLFSDLAPVIAHTELTYANVSLNILPGAISEDAELSLEMETTELSGGVAVTFQPHGITFGQPAILNIEAHGVDFSGVNPNEVDIYYDNPETGQWEPMPRQALIINANAGTVQVINAQLPHFSRYALGDAP